MILRASNLDVGAMVSPEARAAYVVSMPFDALAALMLLFKFFSSFLSAETRKSTEHFTFSTLWQRTVLVRCGCHKILSQSSGYACLVLTIRFSITNPNSLQALHSTVFSRAGSILNYIMTQYNTASVAPDVPLVRRQRRRRDYHCKGD